MHSRVATYCYQCVAGPDLLTVKVEDGGDEAHEPPLAKDAADLKNLVQWILSRE
mgnify:CR=1 FL=1